MNLTDEELTQIKAATREVVREEAERAAAERPLSAALARARTTAKLSAGFATDPREVRRQRRNQEPKP